MERNVMTSFRILSSFDCFLPFSVNCSQVAIFQIMPALCLHGQGEGVVKQMWKALDRGRAYQKFSNSCEHPLWMTPIVIVFHFG